MSIAGSKTITTLSLGFVVICFSLYMLAKGNQEAVLTWWAMFLIFSPLLSRSVHREYVSLKAIGILVIGTQAVTIPHFYMNPEMFQWGHIKPFGFTALEALPLFFVLFLYCSSLIASFLLLTKLPTMSSWLGRSPKSGNLKGSTMIFRFTPRNWKSNNPYRWLYSLTLLVIILGLIPLTLWMLSNGIGITGVKPPAMPFRLAGILHYFTKYCAPVILGLLYFKSRRGFSETLAMMLYATILGLTSVSRSALILAILPVLGLVWFHRRHVMLVTISAYVIFAYTIVTLARKYILVVVGGKISAMTFGGIGLLLERIFSARDISVIGFNYFLLAIVGIADRVDGFGNLVKAKYYDPDYVIGSGGFVLRMIWRPLAPLNVDLHHLQWQGNTLPDGFVNIGGLLSNTIIIGNGGLFWVILAGVVSGGLLLIMEASVSHTFTRYGLQTIVKNATVWILTVMFFIETGGSPLFVFPVLAALLVSVFSGSSRLGVGEVPRA